MALIDTLGYTTINNEWEILLNKELVKHDLLTKLYIRKGECDWDQSLGTTIMDKIFQPKTEQLRLDILSELQEVFESEPRISLIDIQTTSLDKGWIFDCSISYLNGTPESWQIGISEDGVKEVSSGVYPL